MQELRFKKGDTVFVIDNCVIDYTDRALIKKEKHEYKDVPIKSGVVIEGHYHGVSDLIPAYSIESKEPLCWACYPEERVFHHTKNSKNFSMIDLQEEVIEEAKKYIGLTEESNNNAKWLRDLMDEGGNPAHWQPGMAYCISAAAACWGIILKKHGMTWPFEVSAGTQQTYANAEKAGWIKNTPAPGDIVIYRDGDTSHGHAGIVTGSDSLNLSTIEFNTSPSHVGNQREGEGCYAKERSLTAFHGPKANGMWIRSYIKMSRIQAPSQNAQANISVL
jgi:hypothetical protein